MEKLKLAVIFGSRSCEHDVSVISALQLMQAADKAQYEVIPVYITREGAWYTGSPLLDLAFYGAFDPEKPGLQRVTPDVTANACALMAWTEQEGFWQRLFSGGTRLVHKIDVAIPVLHGMNGEDGTVQGLLELANVPYTSPGLVGSAVGIDKIAMKQMFRGCGFPVVEGCWFDRQAWDEDADGVIRDAVERVGLPCIVKPSSLGSSIGIGRAAEEGELRETLAVAFAYDRRVLVEIAIEKPKEVNCSALGFGRDVSVSVCEMPVSWENILTFEEKYIRGAKEDRGGMASLSRQVPAPIGEDMTARVQAMTRDIFKALDCKGVVRIDYMIDGEGALYVNEINTIPGSMAFYLWEPMGVSYAQLIDRLVEVAYRAHAEKNRSVFAYDSSILQKVTMAGAKGAKSAKGASNGMKR